jgi:hypothetical protein
MATAERKRTKVFISYSHKDRRWMERLQDYLKSLSHECPIEVWDDTKIAPGSKWKKEIESAVNSAKVAILLVSVDFLASDFITKNELQPLLAAAEAEDARIIPVIVGPCRFERTKGLSQFQSFNPEDKPLAQMRKAAREKLFNELTSQIEDVMLAPDGRAIDPDGHKQCEEKVAAVRELLLREPLSKYELLHLKKLASEGAYQYKLSDSLKEELRRLRDKFVFIKNKGGYIGQLPPAGDLKEHIELTSNGRRFIKIWEIVLKDEF